MTSTMRPQHNRNARARCEVVVAICASITNFNLYSAAGTCVEDERRGEFMVYESRSRMTSRKESRCSGSPECSSFLVANESAQTALHYFLGNNTEILQCAIARSDCERRKKKLENSWEWTVSMRSCFIELYQNRKALCLNIGQSILHGASTWQYDIHSQVCSMNPVSVDVVGFGSHTYHASKSCTWKNFHDWRGDSNVWGRFSLL